MSTKAADLPDGSIVATRTTVYIKTHPTKWAQWRGTNGEHAPDPFIDSDLADGATVLRVGYGEGE